MIAYTEILILYFKILYFNCWICYSVINIYSIIKVPGIGPATVKVLKENGVSTTYGLIGKYMMLKEEDVEPVEHADRFYFWLKSISK